MKKLILLLSLSLLISGCTLVPKSVIQQSDNKKEDKVNSAPINYQGMCGNLDCKPIIYLYPTHPQNIKLELDYNGQFIVTYPEYDNGWDVFAYPDGKIINLRDNKEYSYLFWEGEYSSNINYDLSSGFIVRGNEMAGFLQDKLSALGLTPKEYNEFIVYWLPQLLPNKYNLVHFATKEEYNDRVKLSINPQPDSLLRVFVVFKALDEKIEVKPQEIIPFSREGFTVVEWGGTKL
jgi:hypothetical protein